MPDVVAYRAFPWDNGVKENTLGGARFVNRLKQGPGRHDSPSHYGVYYCAATKEGAIAEAIQGYRGQRITATELIRFGFPLSLVEIKLSDVTFVDLDDPPQLIAQKTKPSIVASAKRDRTQELARRIFESKADGISWWSTLVSDWTNFSVFASGNEVKAKVVNGPAILTLTDPALKSAAGTLGIRI